MGGLQNDIAKIAYQVAGADNHVKSRDSRIAQTPIKDVNWSGTRGASKCTPTDFESKQLLAKYGQTYVSYDLSGEPNFEPFEAVHVKISDMSDNRQRNFSSMDKKLVETEWAKKNNLYSEAEVRKYRQEHHLTPHECSDGVTMRLVEEDINRRFGHSGGVSELGAMHEPINMKEDGLMRTAGKIQGKTAIEFNQTSVKTKEKIKQSAENLTNIDLMQPVVSTAEKVGDYGKDFAVGAVDAINTAAFSLMVLGVQNICEVASGQKTMEEARDEMGMITANVAVRGGGGKVAEKAIGELAKKTGSELLGFVSNNVNGIVQVANVGLLVFKSFNKLVNDEISGVEFFDEIGERGVALVGDFFGTAAGMGIAKLLTVGMAAGPAGLLVGAGAFVGGMIVTTVCTAIYRNTIQLREKYRAMGEAYRNRIATVNRIANMAIAEMEFRQEQLENMIKEEYSEWSEKFDLGFQTILDAMRNNDFEHLSVGLNEILNVFGNAVKFESVEEFDEFFFDNDAILTL